jgi:hypothetical protein
MSVVRDCTPPRLSDGAVEDAVDAFVDVRKRVANAAVAAGHE